jgi:hypothetical protein
MPRINPPPGGGPSSGYQVVLSDLPLAAQTFQAEGATFLGIMPSGAPPPVPDSGSEAFNGFLDAVVNAVWTLHTGIGGDIEDHGAKLQRAYRRYQDAEESVAALCQQLTSLGETG